MSYFTSQQTKIKNQTMMISKLESHLQDTHFQVGVYGHIAFWRDGQTHPGNSEEFWIPLGPMRLTKQALRAKLPPCLLFFVEIVFVVVIKAE